MRDIRRSGLMSVTLCVLAAACAKSSDSGGGGEPPPPSTQVVGGAQPDDGAGGGGGGGGGSIVIDPVLDGGGGTTTTTTTTSTATSTGATTTRIFGIDSVAVSGGESVADPAIAVSLDAAAVQACIVEYRITGGTASVGTGQTCQAGDDLLLGGLAGAVGTAEILAGESTFTLPITVCPDSIHEGDETLVVTFENPYHCQINTAADTSYAYTFTVLDDDAQPTVAFTAATESQSEGVAGHDVTVQLSNPTDRIVTVNYSVTGTAAGGGVDHATTSGSLSFNPGETAKTVSIAGVVDDALDEDNETVVLTLSAPVEATIGAPGALTYEITDNDALPVVAFAQSFSVDSEPANGSGAVTRSVEVTLNAVSGRTVTVNYQDDGTGDAGTPGDYGFTGGTLTFAPGETAKSFTFTVADDTDNEPAETIDFSLTGPVNATLGGATHTHTVNASDAANSVEFALDSSNAAETAGTLALAVTFTGGCPPVGDLTVDYAIDPSGTAAAGDDFTTISGTLTWTNAGCDTAGKTVNLPVLNDTAFETAETVKVYLSNPSAGLSVGANTVHTVTIDEHAADAPTVEFQSASGAAEETVTSPVVTVVLNLAGADPTERAVTVDYAVDVGNTTAGGSDYTLTGGTLTIPAGSASGTISLGVVNDSLPDAGEVVVIDLSNPGPTADVTLGADASFTYTIQDSGDQAAPTEVAALGVIVETGTSATLHWTSGGGTTNDFRIAYAVGATAPASCTAGTAIAEGAVNAGNRYHTVTGLISGTQYSFRLCAINQSNPPAESAGLTVTATVQASSYPPACDLTITSALGDKSFSNVQTAYLDAVTAGSDGIRTVCVDPEVTLTNDNTQNDSRLVIPSSHFMLRSTSGRAYIDSARTNGAGAAEHGGVYAAGRHNVTVSGFKISTAGSSGAAILGSGTVFTRLSDLYLNTTGASGHGLHLSAASEARAVSETVIQTQGNYAHGIYLAGVSSVGSFKSSKIRRASGAADDTAVAVLFESATNNHFDSSSAGNWTDLYLCDINHASVTWKYYRANSTDPANATAWTNPGVYNAYDGLTYYNAQTFPEGQSGVASNVACPPSWTQVYTTILNPSGNAARCLTGCHAAGQVNKWDLSTQASGYTSGIAKSHFCTTCSPTGTRADCGTSNFIFKCTNATVKAALGWSSTCEQNSKLMPKNNSGGQFTTTEMTTVRDWMEAGAKND